jgi:hypothetical protein
MSSCFPGGAKATSEFAGEIQRLAASLPWRGLAATPVRGCPSERRMRFEAPPCVQSVRADGFPYGRAFDLAW